MTDGSPYKRESRDRRPFARTAIGATLVLVGVALVKIIHPFVRAYEAFKAGRREGNA